MNQESNKKILTIYPDKLILYSMPPEVYVICHNIYMQMASCGHMVYFSDIYNDLPSELRDSIQISEPESFVYSDAGIVEYKRQDEALTN